MIYGKSIKKLLVSAKSLADSQTVFLCPFALMQMDRKIKGRTIGPSLGQPNDLTFRKYVINAIS